MQINPYLSFRGDCEAAFALYERCFGGKMGPLFRYAGSPVAADVPAEWSNNIMHGSVSIGGQVIMGADITPDRYEATRGFTLSVQISSTADAERIFQELVQGRQGCDATQEDVLGRALRNGRRLVWDPVDDQWRSS